VRWPPVCAACKGGGAALYHYGLSRLRAAIEKVREPVRRVLAACDVSRRSFRWHGAMGAAHVALGRADPHDAERFFDRALSLVREAVAEGLDNRAVRVAMVVTLRELGHLAEQRGGEADAVLFQEESLAWARRVGEPRLLARTLEGVAGALSLGERTDEAAGCWGSPRRCAMPYVRMPGSRARGRDVADRCATGSEASAFRLSLRAVAQVRHGTLTTVTTRRTSSQPRMKGRVVHGQQEGMR
jgi:hypothetical protein